jgi:Cu/Zn superoxide dismutase
MLMLGVGTVSAQDDGLNAVAQLRDAQGSTVGSVFFTQTGAKVLVVAQVNGLPPGFHGLHVGTSGQCDAAAQSNQAGDLPAVLALTDGSGYLAAFTDRFKVSDLLDADGSTVIIGANADSSDGKNAGCGVIQAMTAPNAAEANLKAVQLLPLDNLPAKVSRGENAEHGTLTLTLPALGGVQVVGQIASGAAGQIGTVDKDGDFVVFTFTEITYDIAPIELPGGMRIGPQSIKLDPAQTSTLRTNLKTGEILRDFHWIQTATDVLYDGKPSITLGDTAKAQVSEVKDLGGNRYSVRLLTHWKSSIKLKTWTIGGATLPSGEVQATAEFDGIYMLDFNK